MATQGPNSGASFASESNGSGNAWSNVSNAAASDNTYATAPMTGSFYADNLYATNFGFAIPTNATINGITVEFESKGSSPGVVHIYTSQLTKFGVGSVVGSNSTAGAYLGTTDTVQSFGSSSSLWGATWTASEINQSTFGVRMIPEGNDTETFYLDHVKITVTYTPVPDPTTPGSNIRQAVRRASLY